MAVSPNPAFPQALNSGSVTPAYPTTANTNYATPTNGFTIFTAGANGSDVDHVGVLVYSTNTAATVDLFIKNGSNYRFCGSVLVGANTVSATVAKPAYAICHLDGTAISVSNPLHLVSGDTLYVTTSVTQTTFSINASGKDY